MRYLLGVDLGQMSDPTAIVLTEHSRRLIDPNIADTPAWDRRPKKIYNHYITRLIERPALGTPYTDIVERVETLLQSPAIVNETQLIVDATGVGLPVLEMMYQKGLTPIGIWITGGDEVSRAKYGYKVPKRDLATAIQIVFQSRRIKVARGIELAPVFQRELANFRVKITDKGNSQYEAWRSNQHDDIVLAQAIAIWYAEKVYSQTTRFMEDELPTAADWNPMEI